MRSLCVEFGLVIARGVDLAVDFRNLAHPDLALFVFHIEDIFERPVKMVRDISYLLVQPLQGVAQDSPSELPMSTS